MVKFMILFLSIIAISYAQDITDEQISAKDKEHYYQILFNKWRESRNYKVSAPCMNCMGMYEVFKMIEIELKKHYGIDSYKLCESVLVGEQGEYTLTVARELSDKDVALIIKESPNYNPSTAKRLTNNEQIWILYSEKLRKVVSTYKDKRQPDISLEKPSREEVQRWEANRVYNWFLKKWDPLIPTECPSVWEWNLWKNNVIGFRTVQKDIDSVTAVFIAGKAAERCYEDEMMFFVAKLMGDNKEHWMVYCFPMIRPNDWCYQMIFDRYNKGSLFMPVVTKQEYDCPKTVIVILSRKDGQVLYMTR
jgi:hypothetical protein